MCKVVSVVLDEHFTNTTCLLERDSTINCLCGAFRNRNDDEIVFLIKYNFMKVIRVSAAALQAASSAELIIRVVFTDAVS